MMRAFPLVNIFCLIFFSVNLIPASIFFPLASSQNLLTDASHAVQPAHSSQYSLNLEASQQTTTDSATGPLFVNPDNPRYFTDGTLVNGKFKAVFLTGSHTWCNFMDCDDNASIPAKFNYNAFLDFLESKNHNFFRLWRAENVRGGENGNSFWFDPMPYQRSSTCCAFDNQNKFDLTKFNQAYFDRMRQRIIQARDRGIYVSIMLFDGWSVETKFPATHQPWKGHPFKLSNNVNNINGDTNDDGQGGETHTLANSQITALQEAYVKKVIDTVNDLDNVLYEISNESSGNSDAWQYHMIDYIKDYEATKPKQHPVGMTVEYPSGNNADLFNSPADWVSPNGDPNNPSVTNGSKVILADTDHLCGICGDRQWVWRSFTRGENPIFMDIYDNATSGRGVPFSNPNEAQIRDNLGYVQSYAQRMNLAVMTPTSNTSLCSTGYCLRNAVANYAKYLVYSPTGGNITVNLSAVSAAKQLTVEWFNPSTGVTTNGGKVNGGNTNSTFTPPFSGDAVLFVYEAKLATPISSISAQDGWIRETSENSGQGGAINTTASLLYVGDNAQDAQYRSIVSFDTSGLPNDAIVSKIQLQITIQGFTGGNMFTPTKPLGSLLVDIRKPYFGTDATLVAGDFQVGSSKTSVGVLSSAPSTGLYTITLKNTANSFINLSGLTQFRLRFQKDDNDDLGADYLKIFSSESASNGPKLRVTYYLP